MTAPDQLRDDLLATLREARLEVTTAGSTIKLARGSGPMKARASFDPGRFLRSLADLPDRTARRRLAGYARGIRHTLLEPDDSEAASWEFTKAAGSLAMSLEVDSFLDGCKAAAGSRGWGRRLDEDLVFACLIELDMGIRVVTAEQFERWSASPDRVFEGARSMLYHKAQSTNATELEAYDGVEQLSVGDGYDAARCLVLDDLFFGEIDASSRIGMPSPDDLYFVRDGNDERVAELERATRERYRQCEEPLCDALFRFERGTPVRTSD